MSFLKDKTQSTLDHSIPQSFPVECPNQKARDASEPPQKIIYQYLLDLVRHQEPDLVLSSFKHLFYECHCTENSGAVKAIYELIFRDDELAFQHIFKRSCYILINNWYAARKYAAIQQLVQLVGDMSQSHTLTSKSLKRLRTWITHFLEGSDYAELQLFATTYHQDRPGNWSDRYKAYHLITQYTNPDNPPEQRRIAKELARQLHQEYQRQLALFTAHADGNKSSLNEENPTQLGCEVIDLTKRLVTSRLFNYADYARIFVQQAQELDYQAFKQSLIKYLTFCDGNHPFPAIAQQQLVEKIQPLYPEFDSASLTPRLLLKTCKRAIASLTTEDGQTPTLLLSGLLLQGELLTLTIALLKIVLIAKYTKTYLDTRISSLIKFYTAYPPEECQTFINFLEVFNLTFTIYTENTQFNLVKVLPDAEGDRDRPPRQTYRIFSQLKGADFHNMNLAGVDFRQVDLRNADLRGANLVAADLSGANLSSAKLSHANLSQANLTNAKLIASDLQDALLTDADLSHSDLSRANLRGADLSHALLTVANLHAANLKQANLPQATLIAANLSQTNLAAANLEGANLQSCHLNEANLTAANLENAELLAADCHHAQLMQANLTHAKLYRADLSTADLTQATLEAANLYRASLRQAHLNHATLHATFLRNADLSGATLHHANLRDADLSRASLTGADLQGAGLQRSLLRHVDVRATRFNDAHLEYANVFGTDLLQATVTGTTLGNNYGLSAETRSQLLHQGACWLTSPVQ